MALADAFGWAMPAFEIWRFALDPAGTGIRMPSYDDTLHVLDTLIAEGVLVEKHGYYAARGHEQYIEERLFATHRIWGKRQKALRWARRMIRLPYVEGVFAYGSLATGFVKEESDLDVYVVLRNERMFTGRMLATLFLEMFGVRRTSRRIKDQVCLNHFVRRDALTFAKEYRSAFSAWLWARMIPLALKEEALSGDFYDANRWVYGYFPNLSDNLQRQADNRKPGKSSMPRVLGLMNVVEHLLGRAQLARIARHPKTLAETGRVVASAREMIFHPSLPEKSVMDAFQKQLDAFGLTTR